MRRTATEQERGGRGSVREECHEQRGELNEAIFLGGNLLQFVPPTTSSYLHRARERAREGAGWSHPLLRRLLYKQSYHSWTDADGLCWRASLSLPLMLTSPLRAREISTGDPVRPTDILYLPLPAPPSLSCVSIPFLSPRKLGKNVSPECHLAS